MRDSDVDLYTFERLRDEFGPFAAAEAAIVWAAPSANSLAPAIVKYSGSSPLSLPISGKSMWSVAR